jgi:hypothetical protein
VNTAEDQRNARIAAMDDLEILELLLDDATGEVTDYDRGAFVGMRARVINHLGVETRRLSRKERKWAEDAARRIVPLNVKEVPRGRPVETPAVLRHLPKKPPGRM